MDVGPVQILVVAIVILILFGRGRISEMMGDFGKGVKSFRQGMSDSDDARSRTAPPPDPARITHEAKPASETTVESPAADKNGN